MTVLDTSVLVLALTADRPLAPSLRRAIDKGERMLLPAVVLYEWLRGPRTPEELGLQEVLFSGETAIPFGPAEAAMSASLYRAIKNPRGREIDIAIASYAILRNAPLWTHNTADFADIPGLRLAEW